MSPRPRHYSFSYRDAPRAYGLRFAVAGDVSDLAPGLWREVPVRVSNPNGVPIRLSGLTLTSSPDSTPSGCLTATNLEVRQPGFVAGLVLPVPPRATVTLPTAGRLRSFDPPPKPAERQPGRLQEQGFHPDLVRGGRAVMRARATPKPRARRAAPNRGVRALGILVILTVLMGVSGTAWAFWTTGGRGTGTASTGTLVAPSGVAATSPAGSSSVCGLVDRPVERRRPCRVLGGADRHRDGGEGRRLRELRLCRC